mgnify:CR=1 FL=1
MINHNDTLSPPSPQHDDVIDQFFFLYIHFKNCNIFESMLVAYQCICIVNPRLKKRGFKILTPFSLCVSVYITLAPKRMNRFRCAFLFENGFIELVLVMFEQEPTSMTISLTFFKLEAFVCLCICLELRCSQKNDFNVVFVV